MSYPVAVISVPICLPLLLAPVFDSPSRFRNATKCSRPLKHRLFLPSEEWPVDHCCSLCFLFPDVISVGLFQHQASNLRAFTEQTDKYKNKCYAVKFIFQGDHLGVCFMASERLCYLDSWLTSSSQRQALYGVASPKSSQSTPPCVTAKYVH